MPPIRYDTGALYYHAPQTLTNDHTLAYLCSCHTFSYFDQQNGVRIKITSFREVIRCFFQPVYCSVVSRNKQL